MPRKQRTRFNRRNIGTKLKNTKRVKKTLQVGAHTYKNTAVTAPGPVIAQASLRLSHQYLSPPQNVVQSENEIAVAMLFALGVSVETGYPYNQENYSFLEDQTDTTPLENENIFDLTQFKVISKATLLSDKFPNMANPILQPDRGLTSLQQKTATNLKNQTKEPDVGVIAAGISILNSSPAGPTLKQFQNKGTTRGTKNGMTTKNF